MTVLEDRKAAVAGRQAIAALCGIVANVVLGLSSLYWRALASVSPLSLLIYRIILSLLALTVLLSCLRQFGALRRRITKRTCAIHACAAGLVIINWAAFIWASINGHVVESGLGYLVAPFVAIALGAFAFGERLSRPRTISILMIVLSVLWLILQSGELAHWVYLTIGLTWGGYACLKKITDLDSIGGLFLETMVLTALIPIILVFTDVQLSLPVGLETGIYALLFCAGAVSVFPLFLFAKAAAGLPLSVMGLFQFVLPTTQLIVALVFYKQVVSNNTLGCFFTIWVALSMIVLEPAFDRARKQSVDRLESP